MPFRRIRRNDPVFGSMLYLGDRLNYWEGKATFTPTGIEIEIFIDGSADDQMEQQHRFYRELLGQWLRISEDIGKVLMKTLHERRPNVPINSVWDDFKVSSLNIPKSSLESAEWEISFSTPSDQNHLFRVLMKGLMPQQVVIDG